ncbi:hypothetical protein D3C87_1854250 [compost metagenome]
MNGRQKACIPDHRGKHHIHMIRFDYRNQCGCASVNFDTEWIKGGFYPFIMLFVANDDLFRLEFYGLLDEQVRIVSGCKN